MSPPGNHDNNTGRPTIDVGRPFVIMLSDSNEDIDLLIELGVLRISERMVDMSSGDDSEKIKPFGSSRYLDENLDENLAHKAKIGRHKRREISEYSRQAVVLVAFAIIVLFMFFGLLYATYNMMTLEDGWVVERSRWVIETLLGGLIAGLIGFLGIKTFEK